VSHFRRHWLGETDQHIQTMRAVWPARPVSSDVTDKRSDHASPPDREPAPPGVDAVVQPTEASRSRGEEDGGRGATNETSRGAEAC